VLGSAAFLLIGLAAVAAHLTGPPLGSPASDGAPSPTPSREAAPPGAEPQVTTLRRPWLRTSGAWELYVRTDAEVIRIQPAASRVTRTAVPGLPTTGQMSFLVAGAQAIVRPSGDSPGYVVPDGERAQPLPAPFGRGGVILPGPAADEVWLTSRSRYSNRIEMRLVSVPSGTTRRNAVLPGDAERPVRADGGGSFSFSAIGGTYRYAGDGYRRITTGSVLATGPSGWLAMECDAQHRCRNLLIDRLTGARRGVGRTPSYGFEPRLTRLSPDGRWAALVATVNGQPLALHLLDLKRGTDRATTIQVNSQLQEGALAWSPDSAHLFVAGLAGRLWVLDPQTGRVSGVPGRLPPARQLTVKPA